MRKTPSELEAQSAAVGADAQVMSEVGKMKSLKELPEDRHGVGVSAGS